MGGGEFSKILMNNEVAYADEWWRMNNFGTALHYKWNEKLTPTIVGADLWSPVVVGVSFYINKTQLIAMRGRQL